MTEIQPPRYDLIERNNADARAQAAKIASLTGTSAANVFHIVKRHSWAHI